MKRYWVKWSSLCLALFLWTVSAYANTKIEKAFSVEATVPAIQRFDVCYSKSVLVSAFVLFDRNRTLQNKRFSAVYDVVIDTVDE